MTYRTGMLADPGDRESLRETVLQGEALPLEVVESIHENELWDLAGEYGSPEVGDPIQYDELVVEHEGGTTRVTIYNRAITRFSTENEVVKRIHRVCCAIELDRRSA